MVSKQSLDKLDHDKSYLIQRSRKSKSFAEKV
jgi:hypothetical protein